MLSLDEYATIGSTCTVREALLALGKAQLGLTYDRHHHRAVLVLDSSGGVVGKLTHWAILRALAPDMLGAKEVESLERAGLDERFIESLRERLRGMGGSLAAMCQAAGRLTVCDAMVSPGERIGADAPLESAIERMTVARCQSLLVVEDGHVTGIVRLSDVFEEVADLIRGPEGAERHG